MNQYAKKPVPNVMPDEDLSSGEFGDTTSEGALPSAADLTGTVGAFALRMQRKKKEQEQALDTAGQAARIRQQDLLKAMVKIRRSLDEVARLDLGERFRLLLEKDDYHGWPRLTIKLLDAFKPNSDYPMFQVVSHDRQSRGAIEISYSPRAPMEALSLAREGDYKKLPTILKKCVRAYLDSVGEIVLAAEDGRDDAAESAEIEGTSDLLGAAPSKAAQQTAPEKDVDFFDSGFGGSDDFDKLPELSDVQSLSIDFE